MAVAAMAVAPPEFEVASIKPTRHGPRGYSIQRSSGGGFIGKNTTLQMLVSTAYHIQRFQVSGGPSWVDFAGFEVVAKPQAQLDPEQSRQALQALLADRFKLAVHSETKELPAYALVVGKSGPKLPEAKRPDGGLSVRIASAQSGWTYPLHRLAGTARVEIGSAKGPGGGFRHRSC